MQDNRSDLMLFIDLGFILLTGFLVLSDTTPKENVPLPAKEDEQERQAPTEERLIYEVLFDAELDFLVVSVREQTEICMPSGLEAIATCLSPLAVKSSSTVFVLVPQGRATVQQLVTLLDLCRRSGWRCTIG